MIEALLVDTGREVSFYRMDDKSILVEVNDDTYSASTRGNLDDALREVLRQREGSDVS